MKNFFGILYQAFKESILSLVYEKPKPMWISVSLYYRHRLIDKFNVCIDKKRPVVSDSRAHGYKIKTIVLLK